METILQNLSRSARLFVLIGIYILLSSTGWAQTEPTITFSTSAKGNFDFVLKAEKANVPVQVDWGDGKQLLYSVGTETTTIKSPVALSGEITDISIFGENIVYLDVNNKELTGIDVSNCPTLQSLYCSGNGLYQVYVSRNLELKYLHCDQSEFWYFGLDLRQNTKLIELKCSSSFLDELDITNNPQLTFLDCSDNNLSELDLSKNTLLTKLYCSQNGLTSLDLSNNKNLTELDCWSNFLKTLDVANNSLLTELNCNSNELSNLDLTKNLSLKTIDCSYNELLFNTLPMPKSAYAKYVYSPQATISNVSSTIKAGDIIDLSLQASAKDINGKVIPTVYIWKNAKGENLSSGVDYTNPATGKFLFQNKPTSVIYCEMTNQAFPDLKDENVLKTIGIQPDGLALPLAVNLTTTSKTSIYASLKAKADYTPIKIVNGKGETSFLTIGTATSTIEVLCGTSGNASIKIYGDNITYLNCTNGKLINMDVSGAKELTFLSCSYNSLTSINLSGNGKLDRLVCYSNQLSTINISSNPLLSVLNCGKNSLTGLSLSSNPLLSELYCNDNKISALDLSKNGKLSRLNCSSNSLTNSFSVNTNTALVSLDCSHNNIRTLNLTSNPVLEYVDCSHNGFTFSTLPQPRASYKTYIYAPQDVFYYDSINQGGTIDLSNQGNATDINGKVQSTLFVWKYGNTILKEGVDYSVLSPGKFQFLKVPSSLFYCEMTNAAFPDLSGSDAMKFDIKMNPAIIINTPSLKNFWIFQTSNTSNNFLIVNDGVSSYYSQGNSIHVPDKTYASTVKIWGSGITNVKVYEEPDLTSISFDVSNAASLSELNCYDNSNLKSLTISGNNTLQKLNCYTNQLSVLDLSKFPLLTDLQCYGNLLTSLDVSKNVELSNLYCMDNKISALDVSGNLKLDTLACGYNQLASLDIAKNAQLKLLNCSTNKIGKLDVGKNPLLTVLYCNENQLTSLDVKQNPKLEALICGTNSITTLDVSSNTQLKSLYCYENQISALDVTKNSLLTKFSCFTNKLTSLDVSKNGALKELYCYDNQLSSLDVSKNTDLTTLYCGTNRLSSLDVTKNLALNVLTCYDNKLTVLDVSKNTALTSLSVRTNQISSIDIRKNTELAFFSCRDNKLKELDVTKNTKLTELYCFGNALTFANLPQAKTQYAKYQYAPQAAFIIPKYIEKGKPVDLTSQLSVTDISLKSQTTVYQWKTKAGSLLVAGTDYNISGTGKFTFLTIPTDSVYCEMSNAAFPDFTVNNIYKTTLAKITIPTAIDDLASEGKTLIYTSGQTVYVKFQENSINANISVFDIMGRLVALKIADDLLTAVPINQRGVYMVRIEKNSKCSVQKVLINE